MFLGFVGAAAFTTGYVDAEQPKPPTEEWRQVCLDAAAYIEKNGWCQHHATASHKIRRWMPVRACVIGAMNIVGEDYIARWTADDRISNYIGGPIVNWNDEYHRTKAEVVNMLRTVAAKENA